MTADRYLSDRFEWAAPGDNQEDCWRIFFHDRDCGEMIFTGPDAEEQAWATWNRYAQSFNINVFRQARLRDDDVTAKLACVIAHATGGSLLDTSLPLNEISVRITAFRNKIYESGKAVAHEAAEAEIVRLQRLVDAYRLQAVNEGWSWRMVDAYGRAEYLRHRIETVDAAAERTVASGYDAAAYLSDGLAGATK